jgi:hypothetical protein
LGDKGWTKTDVEKFPPVVPRDGLIDLAAHKGVDVLPGTYAITAADLQARWTGRASHSSPATPS